LNGVTITSKNIFRSLDYIRDAWAGARVIAYKLMALAWQVVSILRSDKGLKKDFIRFAKLKAKRGNIADAVMIYVMRAKTESVKKMAWKRSRVLQFLHEQGLKHNKMAREIEARGGIEAIYNQAVKLMPRRNPKSAKEKSSGKGSKKSSDNTRNKDRHAFTIDNDTSSDKQSLQTNDQRTTVQVSLNLSDRDDLLEMSADDTAKLTVKRTNKKGVLFEVIRLKKLPAEPETPDW
jgi:hypothetical protein